MFLQTAYTKAKELVLTASKLYIDDSLFSLHKPDECHNVVDVKDQRSVMLMLNKLYDDENLTATSVDAIVKVS